MMYCDGVYEFFRCRLDFWLIVLRKEKIVAGDNVVSSRHVLTFQNK